MSYVQMKKFFILTHLHMELVCKYKWSIKKQMLVIVGLNALEIEHNIYLRLI